MNTYLEVWQSDGPRLVPLADERLTIGHDESNAIAVPLDERVSRLHAVLERYEAGWALRDLGSTNGTFVNGERLWAERSLRHGDEIRIGDTRLVFRSSVADGKDDRRTETAGAPPAITPRERDVLLALCRPLASGSAFTEPASIAAMARELFVTEAAVKQHLTNLYAKFGIDESVERKRVRLANDALARGAIGIADLRASKDSR